MQAVWNSCESRRWISSGADRVEAVRRNHATVKSSMFMQVFAIRGEVAAKVAGEGLRQRIVSGIKMKSAGSVAVA